MDKFETAKQFFFEGLRLLAANSFERAEVQFARSLELIPDRVSTLNNLSAVKIRLRKFAEAEEVARKAIALEDKSPEAWSNLGIALAATERLEEAVLACDRALNGNPAYAMAWLTKATTLLELKRYDEALSACDQALKLEPNKYEVLYNKSLILQELGRPDEAKKVYRKSLDIRLASSPVFIADRRASQKADVLVINRNPDLEASLNSFETLHFYSSNFPGQLVRQMNEDFHFTSVFVGDATRPEARKQIPQPDLVINNHTNGELIISEGNLAGLIELVDSFRVPVVNHPNKAIQTRRDVSANLLDNISGVRVPKTMRFSTDGKIYEELAREIEGQYDYPLIMRTLTLQRGKGMHKVESRAGLMELLSTGFPARFFVTEFVDSRAGNKLFRKIRAAIVKDEIVVVRVDYDTGWNVHGRKTENRASFYQENAHLLEEEKRICKDPEAGLGRSAMQSLRVIRDRIPMDVFGIDFAVDADGMVVFYEANATMNLFSTARKEVPNPKEAEDRLKQAFHGYLMSLAARR
jgi:tetratricopeptide (TPR) repeat protein